MEISKGIHRIDTDVGGRVACVFLLQGTNDAVLVDTGMNYAPDADILPYLEKISCDPNSISKVILTHSDFDHTGGAAQLRRALPNAQFLCHPAEKTEVQDLEMLITHRLGEFGRNHGIADSPETLAWLRENVSTTSIDGLLTGGEKLDLGGLVAEVLLMPGHSTGHLALYVAESKTAIIADAVLGTSLLFRDGKPAFPPTYRYPGQYEKSIDQLDKMTVDILLTSHFDVMRGDKVKLFLAESRDFVERLEAAIVDCFESERVISLRALADRLAPQFGEWEDDASVLICWPILGHLERMVAAGQLTCGWIDGICQYQKREVLA